MLSKKYLQIVEKQQKSKKVKKHEKKSKKKRKLSKKYLEYSNIQYAWLAQLVEQLAVNQFVAGSNPAPGANSHTKMKFPVHSKTFSKAAKQTKTAAIIMLVSIVFFIFGLISLVFRHILIEYQRQKEISEEKARMLYRFAVITIIFGN